MGTELHGAVCVQQQPGEAGGEVLHEAIGDGAQRLTDLSGQLMVVVLLREKRGVRDGRAVQAGGQAGRTLFLMARSRSRTEPPL